MEVYIYLFQLHIHQCWQFLSVYVSLCVYVRSIYSQFNLITDQPNILIVEAECGNCSTFTLKTNKFTGPLAEHPEQLYVVDHYDGLSGKFELGVDLYMDKASNMQGREVTTGIFDYRPFTVVDYVS